MSHVWLWHCIHCDQATHFKACVSCYRERCLHELFGDVYNGPLVLSEWSKNHLLDETFAFGMQRSTRKHQWTQTNLVCSSSTIVISLIFLILRSFVWSYSGLIIQLISWFYYVLFNRTVVGPFSLFFFPWFYKVGLTVGNFADFSDYPDFDVHFLQHLVCTVIIIEQKNSIICTCNWHLK